MLNKDHRTSLYTYLKKGKSINATDKYDSKMSLITKTLLKKYSHISKFKFDCLDDAIAFALLEFIILTVNKKLLIESLKKIRNQKSKKFIKDVINEMNDENFIYLEEKNKPNILKKESFQDFSEVADEIFYIVI